MIKRKLLKTLPLGIHVTHRDMRIEGITWIDKQSYAFPSDFDPDLFFRIVSVMKIEGWWWS